MYLVKETIDRHANLPSQYMERNGIAKRLEIIESYFPDADSATKYARRQEGRFGVTVTIYPV